MAEFRVDPQQLITQANELQQLNARYATVVDELESSEANLKGMWEGSANDAFHKAFINDKAQMDNFRTAIDDYVAKLLSIAAKYQKAESTNTQTANTRTY